MKLADLKFSVDDCCGMIPAATVQRPDGSSVGIRKEPGGTYSITIFNSEGLLSRKTGQTASQVEAVLPS